MLITDKVLDDIQRRIYAHYEVYPEININSILWECILAYALRTEYSSVIWTPGSHKKGEDINCNGVRISCKAGKITKLKSNPVISISSHRTTRFKTLDEKLNFLSQKHEDVVYSLSSMDNTYRLTIFTPPDVNQFDWHEMSKKWRGVDKLGNILDITKSMSDQYWMKLVYAHMKYNELDKITYDFKRSK
jgi:hypothetical protein